MSISLKSIKSEAKLEKIRLKKLGYGNVIYGNCLHSIAKKYGYKDYKHLTAEFSKKLSLINLAIKKRGLKQGAFKTPKEVEEKLSKMEMEFDLKCAISEILSRMSEKTSLIFSKNELEKEPRYFPKNYSDNFEKAFELLLENEYVLNRGDYEESCQDQYILNPEIFWYEREFVEAEYIDDFIKNNKCDRWLDLNFYIEDGYLWSECSLDIKDPLFRDNFQNNYFPEGFDITSQKVREVFKDEADEASYEIFKNTGFENNNQWVDDNTYLILYGISLNAPWLKENLDYLKNRNG